MQLKIEFNNQSKAPIKKAFFAVVIKETMEECGLNLSENASLLVSLALVDDIEIKKLNKIYRKKNLVTDVLSFAEYKNTKALKIAVDNPPVGGIFLGELVLCYNDVRQYAKRENLNLKNELTGVVAHGVLHLLGLRHGQKMFSIQRQIIKNSNQKRP